MDTLDRRRLLTGAVLGSAALVGATALGSTAPEAAFAHEALDVGDSDIDPNFVEGRITAIAGTLVTVMDGHNVINRVRIADATSVWKLRPTSLKAAEAGDGLYARGVRLDDGTLAADSVWLNIVNLHVEILSIGPDALELEHSSGHLIGRLVPGVTVLIGQHDVTALDLSALQVRSHVQVIGAWRPDTDDVDIAKIYTEV